MYETQTSFGRHFTLFQELAKLLREKENVSNGLVIGAGLNTDDFLTTYKSPVFGFDPSQRFSWEYLELLSALRARNASSAVAVIDPCESVCIGIKEQKTVPVHDFFGDHAGYVSEFLPLYEHELADRETLDSVNADLAKKKVANRVGVLARVSAQGICDLLNQDFMSSAELCTYDAITLLESARYIWSRHGLYGKIKEILKPGGYLLFFDGSHEVPPKGFEAEGLVQIVSKCIETEDGIPGFAFIFKK